MAALEGAALIEGLVDSVTIGTAFAVVIIKVLARWKTNRNPAASVRLCGVDFLHSSVIIPFLLMVGAVFNQTAYDYLKATSASTTAIAGGIGLFFLIGELSKLD